MGKRLVLERLKYSKQYHLKYILRRVQSEILPLQKKGRGQNKFWSC